MAQLLLNRVFCFHYRQVLMLLWLMSDYFPSYKAPSWTSRRPTWLIVVAMRWNGEKRLLSGSSRMTVRAEMYSTYLLVKSQRVTGLSAMFKLRSGSEWYPLGSSLSNARHLWRKVMLLVWLLILALIFQIQPPMFPLL